MKKNKTLIIACAVVFIVAGGFIWYARGVAIPKIDAENDRLLAEMQEEKQKAEEETEYDYTIIPQEEQAASVSGDTGSVTVTVDENGDEWIERDWSKETGGDTKTETKPAESGANIASGGGEVKTDESGVYHGEPEAAKQETPKQEQKPSGNSGSPKDGDRKVENGVTYEYVDWYGWAVVGEGSHTEHNQPSGGDYNKIVDTAHM